MLNRATIAPAFLFTACTCLFQSASAEGAMFHGNPERTGVYSGNPIDKFGQVKWRFHTEGRVISSAAVADGVAYVGSTDGNLYAIDAESGTLKWKFHTTRITSSPAIENGAVYFESYDANLYAIDAASGRLKWQFQTGGSLL